MDGSSLKQNISHFVKAAENDSFYAISFYMPWPFSRFSFLLVKAMHILRGGGKENTLLIMFQYPLLSLREKKKTQKNHQKTP